MTEQYQACIFFLHYADPRGNMMSCILRTLKQRNSYKKLQEYSNKLDSEMEKLEALETDDNQGYETLSRKKKRVYFIVQIDVTNNIKNT